MTTTETTSTSWFSRLGNSLKNIVLGIIFVVGTVILLFWNEGRAVKTEQGLKEGLASVISVSPDKKDAKNEGKLLHFTGITVVPDTLTDDEFAITKKALKMKRTVEVYQWSEEAKSKTVEKLGGGTETTTTYTYAKKWSDSIIDSTNFKESELHQNPTSKMIADKEWIADGVKVGVFNISKDILSALDGYQPFSISQETGNLQSTTMSAQLQLVGGTIYYQTKDAAVPEIGNTRITYEVITPQDISVVYKQDGETLVPYQTKNGSSISMIQTGKSTAEEMFKNAQESNKTVTWILRVVGILFMFIGFQMIFNVLQVIGSVIPFIGRIIGMGTGLVAGILTIILASIVIAIAWIFYRPIIGIGLLTVAIGAYVYLMKNSNK